MIETVIQSMPNQYEVMLNNYASIVEKTNQQLGLWTNPSTLMVGILTLVIAMCAIAVSLYIWKNSRSEKEQVDSFLKKMEQDYEKRRQDDQTNERMRNEKVKKYEDSLDALIHEYEIKLKKVDKKNNKEILDLEKTIDDLKKQKLATLAYSIPEVEYKDNRYSSNDLFSLGKSTVSSFSLKPYGREQKLCMYCGNSFEYVDRKRPNKLSDINNIFGPQKEVRCPFCGGNNII